MEQNLLTIEYFRAIAQSGDYVKLLSEWREYIKGATTDRYKQSSVLQVLDLAPDLKIEVTSAYAKELARKMFS